jgi:ribonuclease R
MARPRQRDRRQQHRQKRHHEQEIPLSARVLSFLNRQQEPTTVADILSGLGISDRERNTVREALNVLEKEGKAARSRQQFWEAAGQGQVRAKLSLTSRGFAFAVLEGQIAKQQKDIFISPEAMHGAGHGDTVLVRMINRPGARPEGEVVRIEKRAFTHLCGIYMSDRNIGSVAPDNDKLPFTVRIKRGDSMDAEDGMAVRVEIVDYGTPQRQPLGRVVEVLGPPDSPQVQIRMAIEQLELPRFFPAEVEAEAAALVPLTEVKGDRRDLRYLKHVTIDGADAKDFDDAICVQKTQQGFRLFVSIADVSHYVQPGSVIDIEAYQRGTSVYFPDTVLPMLPERLSNDLCSLVPDQDRPAFTAQLDFDQQGRRIGEKFFRSLIRSQKRLTYDLVHHMVYLRDKSVRQAHQPLLPMLEKAKELAALLTGQRDRRGSIGFAVPEADIRLEGSAVASFSRAERNQAHMLIEEFMLAANEAVAEHLARAKMPVLYRVHEPPDPDKVQDFIATAAVLGLDLPKPKIHPAWFAEALAKTKNAKTEYVVNNLLLRTMQRARYTSANLHHFGLAAEFYLHFTSPIRRYPDLVAHRVLQNLLSGQKAKVLPEGKNLEDAGLFLSGRERVSVEAERDVDARLAAIFMRQRIGEEFEAIISGVTSFGLFVELTDSLISGAVPVKDMTDDYYLHDSTGHRLTGERSGKIYRLGDVIRVQLVQVDLLAKKITFVIVPQEKQLR